MQALDACANPYIALAALVTAGMMGIEGDAALPAPVDVDPASLPNEAAADRLPTSLKEAIEALLRDTGGLSHHRQCQNLTQHGSPAMDRVIACSPGMETRVMPKPSSATDGA